MNRKGKAESKGASRKRRVSDDTYFVIMAGGKGERFWPLSTELVPKPFVSITGKKTLIELTVERALRIAPLERIFVVLGREHLPAARRCLPRLPHSNFIIEPVGRDTAPCVGLAAMRLHGRDPDAVMVVLPSDHYVPDPAAFSRCIRETVKAARRGDHLVTIGIPPSRPETGYGYIKTGRKVSTPRDADCFEVARYVEKPNLSKARRYLREGGYFWNAGIFVWRAEVLLEGLRTHMPDLHAGLTDFCRVLAAGGHDSADAIFARLPRVSIDYGLMEKATNVLMMPAPFTWDDVGTWTSLLRVLPGNDDGNVLRGKALALDTDNCVVIADTTPVATLGVSDLVIIASKNGILICDASRAQDVRQIAKALGKK